MNKRTLVITLGGPATPGRIVHLQKILLITSDKFDSVGVVVEGRTVPLRGARHVTVIDKSNRVWGLPSSFLLKAIRFGSCELERSKALLRQVDENTDVLFLGIYQPLTLLAAKVRHCRTHLFGGGFDVKRSSFEIRGVDSAYFRLRWAFQMIMLKAFDRIIVESPRVVDSFKLTKFATKIRTSGSLFVDEKEFMPAKRLIDRELDLVFVGGLTSEKGIMIFADCIKRVCAIRPLKALIIGDGALRKPLETYLKKWQLESAVQLKYWVRYSDMPAELNRARMLLVPSMSEGVPNVILEAMACGTIVLASSAGGIRDVVVDGQTGFILESLDPSYIAKTVVGILDDTALMEKVTNRGRLFVESRFTLNAARNAWNYIFNQDDISNSTLKSA